MRRRTLIAAGTTVALAPHTALASDPKPGAAPATLEIENLGLPVIADGRLRNYVFVEVRLLIAPGQPQEAVRVKAPHLRDALVRAAHATPFTRPNDWNSLDATALSAAMMRAAATIVGRGMVTRVELVAQTPRRRLRAPNSQA